MASRQSEIDNAELNAFLDDYYKKALAEETSSTQKTENVYVSTNELKEIAEDHYGINYSQSQSQSDTIVLSSGSQTSSSSSQFETQGTFFTSTPMPSSSQNSWFSSQSQTNFSK